MESKNSAQLLENLEHLISNEKARDRLGEKARIIAEKYYDREVYFNKLIDLYSKKLGKIF